MRSRLLTMSLSAFLALAPLACSKKPIELLCMAADGVTFTVSDFSENDQSACA